MSDSVEEKVSWLIKCRFVTLAEAKAPRENRKARRESKRPVGLTESQ